MQKHDSLMTPQQAADYLQYTRRFLEARRYRGGGPPFVQVSARSIRYRRADLDAWVESKVRQSTSDPVER